MNFENKKMYLTNGIKRELIADKLFFANSILTRFKGLMGQRQLEKGNALILYPCSSIHMFFMRFPIDVIYCDKDFKILKVVRNLKPWRINFGISNAKYTIELPVGSIPILKDKSAKIYIEN